MPKAKKLIKLNLNASIEETPPNQSFPLLPYTKETQKYNFFELYQTQKPKTITQFLIPLKIPSPINKTPKFLLYNPNN